ncbi:hypothetical protein [Streptomyces sp. NPDC051636]|uniref:hypothetical protein n=1 Tax=Streptomyces sp. NPDC051636 TaxID=3365663 RepID=UPI003793337B
MDRIGRSQIYFNEPQSSSDFLRDFHALGRFTVGQGGSRWWARGLVTDAVDSADLRAASVSSSPLEVTQMPARGDDGRTMTFVQIAQNSEDRMPSAEVRGSFIQQAQRHIDFEEKICGDFHHRANTLVAAAMETGVALVCNDPTGEWGMGITADVFRRLIKSVFFVDDDTASKMLQGKGYSPRGHYLFGIRHADGRLSHAMVYAKWPWGFEATYIMKDDAYTGGQLRHAASLLALLSSALVLGRHGGDSLCYGETNAASSKTGALAGFRICRPDVVTDAPLLHRNILWAENPLGYSAAAHDGQALPPPYNQWTYENYTPVMLDSSKVQPYRETAMDLLAA